MNFWETITSPFKKAGETISGWFKEKPKKKAMTFEVGAGMTEAERKRAEEKIKDITKPIERREYESPSLAKETALQLFGVGKRVSPIPEATTGALKGMATGIAKGLTLGYWFPKFKMTETEKEAARITRPIGELESWLIPFGALQKGLGWAGKLGIKAIPKLAKAGAKAPLLARMGKAALPFAAISGLEKPAEGQTREEAMWQGALFGAAFPLAGAALKPITKPMMKAAGKALKRLAKQPATITIKNLPKAEREILGTLGVRGETISKDIYERTMRMTAGIRELAEKPAVKIIKKETYELPAELMPKLGKPTWKHSKMLWNTMRNQYGQANKFTEDVTRNKGTVAWIIDTLEGGKKELAPMMKKYEGRPMDRWQYKKLYAMFKAHDYNIEGYKKVMGTLKGIEPMITTERVAVEKVAEKIAKKVKPKAPTAEINVAELFKEEAPKAKAKKIAEPEIMKIMRKKGEKEIVIPGKTALRAGEKEATVNEIAKIIEPYMKIEGGYGMINQGKKEGTIKLAKEIAELGYKPQIVPHPAIKVTYTIRPYKLGYGCDGSTTGNVLYLAKDMAKKRGLDFEALYKKAYPGEKYELLKTLDKYGKETILPKAWGKKEIETVIRDLHEVNNHRIADALKEAVKKAPGAVPEIKKVSGAMMGKPGFAVFKEGKSISPFFSTEKQAGEWLAGIKKAPIKSAEELIKNNKIRPVASGYGQGRFWEYKDVKGTYTVAPSKEEAIKRANKALAIKPKAEPVIPKPPAEKAMEGVPSITPMKGGFLAKRADGIQQFFKNRDKAYEFLKLEKAEPPKIKPPAEKIKPPAPVADKIRTRPLEDFEKDWIREVSASAGGQYPPTTIAKIMGVTEADIKAVLKETKGVKKIPVAERAEQIRMKHRPKVKELEEINKKAIPVRKAGKEIAPKQMRLDEAKPAPPGKPPKPPEEIPLAQAPPPPEGSGLEAIDKMVGKPSRPRRLWEWLKGVPKGFTKLFTDRFSAMKRFEDDISKLAGKPIDINSSSYVAARNYAGRIGTVEMNLRDLQNILSPLRKHRADFTRFTLSKRAMERASRGFKNPAGVTEEQAKRALGEIRAKVGKTTYKAFENTEKAIQDWADKAILKPALKSGIISKKAYEAIVTKNKHWMPFQVLDYLPTAAEADMIAVGSETFSVSKQRIIKSLKGTEKTIRDPFEAIIDRLSESVSLVKKNEVAKKLIALRKEFPAAKELIKPLARVSKQIDKATGKRKLIWDLRPPKDWNSISVFINGKATKWAVPEDLGHAMHAMNPVEAGVMGGFLRFTSTAFRRGATTLYIPFSLSNAFRDAQMAILCSKWGFNPADWLKGFGAGLKGSFGWESKLYNDFMRNQGGYGGFIQSARAISGARKALFEPSWWRKTKAVINPVSLISNFAEAIELAPRLGVYKKGIAKGATALEAAYEARRVTIDFARAGQEARIINMWIPFVNARWQALLNTARVFREHPARSAARATGLVVMPGVTTYYWNTLNYPDLYDDIPQWAKDTYFILIVGEEIDERGNRVPKIIQIPKGDVGQIFYNPIEYALEYVRKGEPQNWAKLGLEWLSQLSPIPFTRDGEPSATSFLAGGLPPAVRTPIELATNECFFMDYPIVPRRLEKVAPSEQYDERTPQLAITIGRALGISPMKLAYGVGGLLGGFGREALDPLKILDLTVKRFYRTSGGAKRNEAWNLMDELTIGYNTVRLQSKKAIEQGRPEAADALIREWNRKAESVIPDITLFIAEDDPKEAEKIAKKVTFQPNDIKRLKKMVQEEIEEIKKTPSGTPTKGYWGAESAPPTMGAIFPARPAGKVTADYWR